GQIGQFGAAQALEYQLLPALDQDLQEVHEREHAEREHEHAGDEVGAQGRPAPRPVGHDQREQAADEQREAEPHGDHHRRPPEDLLAEPELGERVSDHFGATFRSPSAMSRRTSSSVAWRTSGPLMRMPAAPAQPSTAWATASGSAVTITQRRPVMAGVCPSPRSRPARVAPSGSSNATRPAPRPSTSAIVP